MDELSHPVPPGEDEDAAVRSYPWIAYAPGRSTISFGAGETDRFSAAAAPVAVSSWTARSDSSCCEQNFSKFKCLIFIRLPQSADV